MDFCALVIEHPMQWPSRLNLHTSIQGVGILLILVVLTRPRVGQLAGLFC